MEFFNSNIQLDVNVIVDIFKNIRPQTKMLVFGLGYDSKMWYEGTKKNTYFVENNESFIEINKNDIPSEHITKYDYLNITCQSSVTKTDEDLKSYKIPDALLLAAPFDIILIDGPEGWCNSKPGRLIPCFWARSLSKSGTLIYVDDAKRPLEHYSINRFFNGDCKEMFNERNGCVKIYM